MELKQAVACLQDKVTELSVVQAEKVTLAVRAPLPLLASSAPLHLRLRFCTARASALILQTAVNIPSLLLRLQSRHGRRVSAVCCWQSVSIAAALCIVDTVAVAVLCLSCASWRVGAGASSAGRWY